MDRIRKLFLLLALLASLHMLEQLAFGISERALFANTDRAMVLVAVAAPAVLLLACGLLAGGLPRLISIAVFAVLSIVEAHHIVETFLVAAYTPGVVTAVPFVAVGAMLLVAIRAEFRRTHINWADVAPAYQTW